MTPLYEDLTKAIQSGLPGLEAHKRLAPEGRSLFIVEGEKQNAGVLILLYKDKKQQWCIVFIKRPSYNGHHSAQISFPGGKEEAVDIDLKATALRECQEEIGIDADQIRVVGKLTELYIPVSNFLVHPYIGILNSSPGFSIDTNEVEYLIHETIQSILRQPIEFTTLSYSGRNYRVPFYKIKGEMVWGATAMILSEFIEVLKKIN